MFKGVYWVLDRLFLVLGALLGSQIPSWMQQYNQRLGGHVNELQSLTEKLNGMAIALGKTPEEYLRKLLTSSDADIVKQGEFIQSIYERSEQLSYAWKRLLDSPVWEKPFILIKTIDYDVASSTLASFQPSLSLTLEGIVYTGVGILIGCLTFHGIAKSVARLTRGVKRKPPLKV